MNIYKIITELEEIVRQKIELEPVSFSQIWNNLMLEFHIWLESVADMTSKLTMSLELIRRVCEAFQKYDLKDDIRIVNLILNEALPIGKSIKLKGPDGLIRNFSIIRREISNNFMVKYTLKSEDGVIITREYVD